MPEDRRGTGTGPEADAEQSWQEALAAGLVGRSKDPLNCELTPPMLGGEVTPERRFFRRNHFPMPVLDPASWRLAVGGLVREPLSLQLCELRDLPAESVTVTLECAGNGRTGFSPPVPGERWDLGAVSTACWTGARLSDVLDRAGLRPGVREVVFRGADGGPLPEVPGPVRFERSLPVRDAVRSGALLAYAMNGRPLPVAHGFPVRLVVPGWYAVAAVKWLTEIEVVGEPFLGLFQDSHYVYEWNRDGRAEREPVRVQRVRAMIAAPAAGEQVPGDELAITGVAWSGAAHITHVEVAVDTPGTLGTGTRGAPGTGTWRPAELVGPASRFGWQRWQLRVRGVPAGTARVRARAADAAGNNQLAEPEWNALGYGGNFVHEVTVTVGRPLQLALRSCPRLPDSRAAWTQQIRRYQLSSMSTAPVPESQAATGSDGPGRQHADGALTLNQDQISRRLAEVADGPRAASGTDRARIIVIRGGRLAAIERFRQGRHYWVLPGGGVEEGETIAQAAVREAAEELGISVRLGALRAIVHGRDESGRRMRHWCFDAVAESDNIMVTGGPEADAPPEWGTYKAVWLSLDRLEPKRMWPSALAELVAAGGGKWPAGITQIIEP